MKRNLFVVATTILIVYVIICPGLIPELATASANSPDAEVSPHYPEWQLTVTGFVENPLNLSWAELVALPQTIVNAELICVDFPDYVVMSGNWTGVKLGLLLETAGISSQALKVGFFATDGFSTDLPIETAMRDDIILAYKLNGEPLDGVLRLVVPGKWGYKWIHHVGSIILFSDDFLGHYESRGFSDEANVNMPSPPSNLPSSPSEIIPEFPSILPLAIAVILITVVAVIMKKRVKKLLMHTSPR
jgi:DMSO/TMAO reductase YedYZ molybdopterin-dependent catalytic subunit